MHVCASGRRLVAHSHRSNTSRYRRTSDKLNALKLLTYIQVCLLIASCASRPAAWASDLGSKLRCGMSVSEVQGLANRPVEPLNRDWATHFIRDGATDVWLTFSNGQLSSYQIAWVKPLTIVEKADPVKLCK